MTRPADSGYVPPSDDAALKADAARERALDRQPSRSLLVIALTETFRRTGARVGSVWIVLMIVVATFAPFLANTRPLLVKYSDGSLGSPLLAQLNAIDIALPIIFLVLLGLFAVRRFVRFKLGAVMLTMIATIAVSGILGFLVADPPLLERYAPERAKVADGTYAWTLQAPIPFSPNDRLGDLPGDPRTVPPSWSVSVKKGLHNVLPFAFGPPSAGTVSAVNKIPTFHWLGTTVNGEDMLSRMIHATRVALAIGFIATGISTLIGIVIGALMGYFGGWVDLALMRVIEILQAIPTVILLLIVMVFFGKNIWYMMITIGLVSWTADARFIRAEFLKLRSLDFVQAARALALPLPNVLFRHMLPNGIAPVFVNASFGIAGAILLESFLSFIGLGLEAKDPSWGALLNQARSGGSGFNWWIAVFPGLAIFLTVFAYILIGESMRDAIDPKLRKD